MALDAKHPLYTEHVSDWQQMRDTYRGQRIVKSRGFSYLPATAGMEEDGLVNVDQPGFKAYNAYRTRARFPDFVREAVEALLGVMHRKPPVIELPAALEPLRENATRRNESLAMFLRRLNEEQLVTGRAGLLLDVVDQGERTGQPYFALYTAETIINWDEGRREETEIENLNFVALDESENERIADFEWEWKDKYRILILGDVDPNEPPGEGTYSVGVFRETQSSFDPTQLQVPSIMGRTLNFIPFVFVNSKDVVPMPDDPPLVGLSNLALAVYRGEADYRQSLFMQGQDTLVISGAAQDDDKIRVGANAVLHLTQGADAKFIGVDSGGLPEQRLALENDYNRARAKSGELLDTVSREKESGDALRVRVAAKTATLNQVALTGAFGLEQILKMAATWVGANPDEVIVTPNLDFIDDQLSGKAVTEYMTAKSLGAPLSLKSIHEIMQDRGLTEFSFEDEVSEIERERELELMSQGTTNPDGPEDDEVEEDEEDEELVEASDNGSQA